jgi:hypothetical protein
VLGGNSPISSPSGHPTLGGSQFVDRFMEFEEGGEFRGIQYQVTIPA